MISITGLYFLLLPSADRTSIKLGRLNTVLDEFVVVVVVLVFVLVVVTLSDVFIVVVVVVVLLFVLVVVEVFVVVVGAVTFVATLPGDRGTFVVVVVDDAIR